MANRHLKKQKLREAIIVSANQAIRHERLSDSDREALIESARSSALNIQDKKLTEAVIKLLEQNKIGSSRWSFPVSRIDYINANRRRYSKDLWEKVLTEQKNIWEGCVGLADHPPGDADPEFKHSAVVWSNLRMDEANKLMWADAIFVGDKGRLAEEILEAGGKVGFSTAGLGDLERVVENIEGRPLEFYEVVPSEFILERIADVVPNPSQDVFGVLDMRVAEASDQATAQKLEPTESSRAANTTGQPAEPVKGNEADVPEFSEKEPLPTASTETREEGDLSLQENLDWAVQQVLNEDCGGGDGGDGGADAGVSSEGFQAEAPENVTTVTEPGKRKKEEGNMKATSYESRRAKEDIKTFLEKADALAHPKDRLREYTEILQYVDETNLVDMKEAVQKRIQDARTELATLIERGAEFAEIFGTDITVRDVQGAMKSLNSVKESLSEGNYDWKQVSVKMAKQLKRFVEAVDVLRGRPTHAAYDALKARTRKMQESLTRQMHAQRKVAKQKLIQLEADLNKTRNALREHIKESKARDKAAQKKVANLVEANRRLKESNKRLQEQAKQVSHEFMRDDVKYLFDSGRGAKQSADDHRQTNRKMTEAANTSRHSSDKAEVTEYYDSLLRKHGSSILPYSKQILESKNYREAVNTFMRIMDDKTGFDPQAIVDLENPVIWDLLGDA